MYFDERTFAWQTGDVIVVNGASVAVTNNRAEVPIANRYYAMYPQQYVQSMNGNSIALNIPRIQEYRLNDGHQVIHSPLLAVADGDASSLSFKNLGSLLAITITNDGNADLVVDSVTLTSVDATIALWGDATISNPDSDHPQYEFSSAAASHGSTMLAKVNDGVAESMNITLGAQCSTKVYMFIPAVPANVNNRFSITICGHTETTINKYTLTQSNNGGGNIARNTLTAVPFQLSVANSDIRNITTAPEGALTGLFSVSSTRRVYFSKGNLVMNNGVWSFSESQSATYSYQAGATGSIGLFFWDDFSTYSITTGEGSSSTGWRALTEEEWKYLLGLNTTSRVVNGGRGEGHCYQRTTINNIYGMLIFPDGFTQAQTSYSSIPDGCVFLPVTGRYNSSLQNRAAGYYWTNNEYMQMSFNRNDNPSIRERASDIDRYAVRLVRNI